MEYSLAGFNGQRPDPVSGHYHPGNGYRACSPALGRFTAPDSWSPFGAGGINPYAYCAGDPVNRADPSGHFSLGQGIGMALGFVAGIALSILTEGAAMPVALTLMATVAGDAAIGAGAELATEAIDGQRINWGQVGLAAGMSAGASLAGFGLGRLSKLKGTSSRPFGGLMITSGGGIIHDAAAEGAPQLSGQFRHPRFLGLFRNQEGNVSPGAALSFVDGEEGTERLTIFGPVCSSAQGGNISMGAGIWTGRGYAPVSVDPIEMANLIGLLLISSPEIRTVRLAVPFANRVFNDVGSFRMNVEYILRQRGINQSVTAPQHGFGIRGPVPTQLENILTGMEQNTAGVNGSQEIPPQEFQRNLNNMSARYANTPGAFEVVYFIRNRV